MRKKGEVWTAQQIELAQDLVRRKANDVVFMKLLGTPKKTAQNKLYRMQFPLSVNHYVDSRISVPEEVWEDRNRRLMAQKSLTATLLGDPEPGRAKL